MTGRRLGVFVAALLAAAVLIGGGCSSSESEGPSVEFMGLSQALGNGLPTLAEFGSDNCIPCKRMRPILAEMVAEYEGKLNIAFVDVYKDQATTREYSITSIPTQIIFDAQGNKVTFEYQGREVDSHVGFWAKEDMMAQLTSLGLD